MDFALIKNRLRNKMGQILNPVLPPQTQVLPGSGDLLPDLIFVSPRWDYRSRFTGDAFAYTRFVPAFKQLAGIVHFIPIENKRAITAEIRRIKRENHRSLVFSCFQNLRDIPDDYFELSKEGFYLVNWYTDDDMLFDTFSAYVAKRFNLNVTTFEPNLARYEDINANAIASQWAGIEGCNFLETRKYAACFIGRMYGQRAGLIKKLKKEFRNRIFINNTMQKPISENRLISAYQNSWLAIDEPTSYDGKTQQIKARIFENASMGCLVLTKPNVRIARYFEPNEEILFWETIPELIATIKDCIDNPDGYKKMARSAYERTHKEHLYEHRFQKIFEYCKKI